MEVPRASPAVDLASPASPILYPRRFLIIISYTLTYFTASWAGNKGVIITPSFAKYHNTTNELNFEEGGGIDLLGILGNAIVLVSYFVAAWVVDRFGLW